VGTPLGNKALAGLNPGRRLVAALAVVEAYRGGRLTLRELAAMLGLDIWATHDLLAAEGVAVAQGSMEETAADLAATNADLT
jgi:predicted HTH domain antitoxin